MYAKHFLLFVFLSNIALIQGQVFQGSKEYTRGDTLRGSLRPERSSYDVLKYNLNVKVEPSKKYISGFNEIFFRVIENMPIMQLDLFENMKVDSIVHQGEKLNYTRDFNAVFITFKNALIAETIDSLSIHFSGHPTIAKTPPWDGGFVFSKDKNGKDWVSVAVQGTGASLWYPNKDHQSDKPEEAEIHVAAPNGLMNISNGRFTGKKDLENGFTEWSWKVTNPINNYNIILNIGDYVHFADKFRDLDLNYYVLAYNLEKAKKQFQEVIPMMECFYEHFGEYPFKEDAYKLVETPYLGMEHQSAIAYGNEYKMGYAGTDISKTGIGKKFDFIIIHETGHEWFGNSITSSDIADMWIHEAFTSYAEAVYIECRWGKEDALKYFNGLQKTMISNEEAIIGDYGVNKEGSFDMYYKGANMLNTIRSVINDDEKWWALVKDFSENFKHKITNSEEVIAFFEENSNETLAPIFNQYLYHSKIPVLLLKKEKKRIYYRWDASVENFKMPIDVKLGKRIKRIKPNSDWEKLRGTRKMRKVNPDLERFYVEVEKL
ncbi:M1 family metallopeptidase [Brumimicrobium mesophilum]|uniref:M1 family metallopeptidase n=1 Tax=Brumimicrobium mesophilum TaxID=392717 RepID=UPI000D1406E1|nr:M1 family metallopeptidase [Brumimicrobium mesophilum]